jgi:hypothetical protein
VTVERIVHFEHLTLETKKRPALEVFLCRYAYIGKEVVAFAKSQRLSHQSKARQPEQLGELYVKTEHHSRLEKRGVSPESEQSRERGYAAESGWLARTAECSFQQGGRRSNHHPNFGNLPHRVLADLYALRRRFQNKTSSAVGGVLGQIAGSGGFPETCLCSLASSVVACSYLPTLPGIVNQLNQVKSK